jgi:hypothetical protein
MIKYKGYSISNNFKSKDCYSPFSGHRWTEDEKLKTFTISGPCCLGEYRLGSIETAKQYIDFLVRVNKDFKMPRTAKELKFLKARDARDAKEL